MSEESGNTMLQVTRARKGPDLRVWLVSGLLGLAALLIIPLSPVEVGGWVAFILGVVLPPIGLLACLWGAHLRLTLLLLVFVPSLAGFLYEVTWLIPPPSVMPIDGWIVMGILSAVIGAILVRKQANRQERRYTAITCLALLWWTLWAVAMVASAPSGLTRMDDVIRCRTNLKIVWIASREYEDKFGTYPRTVDEMISAGLLRSSEARCPVGPNYILAYPPLSHQVDCSAVCVAHAHSVVLLRQDGLTLVFTERRNPLLVQLSDRFYDTFGPPPWYKW